MILENKKKIEGGKFARIKMVVEDKEVHSVKITGDFFLYPNKVLEKIEGCLASLRFPLDESDAERRINKVLKEEDAELIGVSAKDLAEMMGSAQDEI